jgi:hypothetical protein
LGRAQFKTFTAAGRAYVHYVSDPVRLRDLWAPYRLQVAEANVGGIKLREHERPKFVAEAAAIFEETAPRVVDAVEHVDPEDWIKIWPWVRLHNLDTSVPGPFLRVAAPLTDPFSKLLVKWGLGEYLQHHNPLEPASWRPERWAWLETSTELGGVVYKTKSQQLVPCPVAGVWGVASAAARQLTLGSVEVLQRDWRSAA